MRCAHKRTPKPRLLARPPPRGFTKQHPARRPFRDAGDGCCLRKSRAFRLRLADSGEAATNARASFQIVLNGRLSTEITLLNGFGSPCCDGPLFYQRWNRRQSRPSLVGPFSTTILHTSLPLPRLQLGSESRDPNRAATLHAVCAAVAQIRQGE